MIAVQVTMPEDLIRELDADAEVQVSGRSAVVRTAVRRWLAAKAEQRIAADYRRAYSQFPPTEEEFGGFGEGAAWPE